MTLFPKLLFDASQCSFKAKVSREKIEQKENVIGIVQVKKDTRYPS